MKLTFKINLLLLMFIINSCVQEDTIEKKSIGMMEHINLEDDDFLKKGLNHMNYYSPNSRVAGTEFGSLNYDEIYKSILGENQVHPNYMIRVNPPEDVPYSLEYFVMVGEDEGFRAYIIQYLTDEENYHTLDSLQKFTGYFRVLDRNRKIRASNYYVSGQLSNNGNQRTDGDEYFNCNCVGIVDEWADIESYSGTGSGFGSGIPLSVTI